jgi:hypothetical protein
MTRAAFLITAAALATGFWLGTGMVTMLDGYLRAAGL